MTTSSSTPTVIRRPAHRNNGTQIKESPEPPPTLSRRRGFFTSQFSGLGPSVEVSSVGRKIFDVKFCFILGGSLRDPSSSRQVARNSPQRGEPKARAWAVFLGRVAPTPLFLATSRSEFTPTRRAEGSRVGSVSRGVAPTPLFLATSRSEFTPTRRAEGSRVGSVSRGVAPTPLFLATSRSEFTPTRRAEGSRVGSVSRGVAPTPLFLATSRSEFTPTRRAEGSRVGSDVRGGTPGRAVRSSVIGSSVFGGYLNQHDRASPALLPSNLHSPTPPPSAA